MKCLMCKKEIPDKNIRNNEGLEAEVECPHCGVCITARVVPDGDCDQMGSSTYVGKSHLEFKKIPLGRGRKLPRYDVINKKTGEEIGFIHWHGGWRQYVFQAEPGVDMSRSCQKEVIKFIDEIMKKWYATSRMSDFNANRTKEVKE